ncbi:MAG: hypothetical protein PHY54_20665, partial [Methylococcales bacterium]|nr:hypothetical protein [Methylococcales bacterium]
LWHDGDESGLRAFGLKLKLTQVCTSSDSLETSKSLMDYLGSNKVVRFAQMERLRVCTVGCS